MKITSKKVHGSKVDFSTIEITLTKVCGNNVDFSISEITSKKYEEITWKFVEIWSSMYRRNIRFESTSIQRGVPVGNMSSCLLLTVFWIALVIYGFWISSFMYLSINRIGYLLDLKIWLSVFILLWILSYESW